MNAKKGEECEYRHFEGTIPNKSVCKLWVEGNCTNKRCILRHPSGVQTFCRFFNQGICTKGDDCPFVHVETVDPKEVATKKSLQTKKTISPQTKQTKVQSKKTISPQTKQTKAPQSKQTISPQTKQTISPQPKQTKAPQSKQTKAPQSKQTKTPQSKQTISPQSKQTKTPQSKQTKVQNQSTGNISSSFIEEIRKKNEKKFGTSSVASKVSSPPKVTKLETSNSENFSENSSPKRKSPDTESTPAKRSKTSSPVDSTIENVSKEPPVSVSNGPPTLKEEPRKIATIPSNRTFDDIDKELEELGVDFDEDEQIDIDGEDPEIAQLVGEL